MSEEMDMFLTHDWSRFRFSANSPVITYDGMSEQEMRQLMDEAFYSLLCERRVVEKPPEEGYQ
jgi:hypothetical protein